MAGLTTTLALMTTGLVAGTSAIQHRRAARGVERMGAREQEIAEQNAQLAEQQAEDELMIGREEAQRHAMGVRQFMGAQRARLAAQGIDIGAGSPADVLGETSYFGELDRLTIENNARRRAWGYRAEAANIRNQGAYAGLAARTQAASLRNQSWSSLLTGAANMAGIASSSYRGGGTRLPSRDTFEGAMRRAGY